MSTRGVAAGIGPGGYPFASIPAFCARVTATIPNVTGNGTAYVIVFNAAEQNGSNFNTSTGVFTAPVTGWYTFSVSVNMEGLSTATGQFILLVTSNRSYRINAVHPNNCDTAGGDLCLGGTLTVFMDAADTASISVTVSGLAGDTADVSGNSGTSLTTFSGILAAA